MVQALDQAGAFGDGARDTVPAMAMIAGQLQFAVNEIQPEGGTAIGEGIHDPVWRAAPAEGFVDALSIGSPTGMAKMLFFGRCGWERIIVAWPITLMADVGAIGDRRLILGMN